MKKRTMLLAILLIVIIGIVVVFAVVDFNPVRKADPSNVRYCVVAEDCITMAEAGSCNYLCVDNCTTVKVCDYVNKNQNIMCGVTNGPCKRAEKVECINNLCKAS